MADLIRTAREFGQAVRERRSRLRLTQEELAARCGVGRRFIAELEAGKPTSQLGKALLAASEVGLTLSVRGADGTGSGATRGEPDVPPSAPPSDVDADPLAGLPRF